MTDSAVHQRDGLWEEAARMSGCASIHCSVAPTTLCFTLNDSSTPHCNLVCTVYLFNDNLLHTQCVFEI